MITKIYACRRYGEGVLDLVRIRLGESWVGARDMVESDIEHFVSYWHDGVADLEFLGIDLAKLGTRDDTRARFRAMCKREGAEGSIGFTFYEDASVIGYTNINIRDRSKGYVHVHLTDPGARDRGLMSTIFLNSLPVIGDRVLTELNLDGLVLETRTRNTRINRVVQKTGLRPDRTEHLETPDGIAGPGEFHIYELDRNLIAMLSRAVGQTPAMESTK